MDDTLDKTTLATISLLEARLLRIEHVLYGPSPPRSKSAAESASASLADLERRFAVLIRRYRVYAEILKIYKAYPSLFQPPAPDSPPPTELSAEALRATVLSYAASFPSTASALTAITSDTPVPDPKLSAELASLVPRMKGVEATQLAQEADIAELRARSERVMRAWYEGTVLRYGDFMAGVEGRFEKLERAVRRTEKLRELESSAI
ncbi:nuclear distribution protein [Podospora appendiculata]|uniref:Nuclear distribution protein n=1 Tax=Podospora appendiculata TaxID=314037 RepID=A0AAE0XM79_9PEZI|nr:nuclear distribution protein [Podospora appendiculata]